MSTIREEDMCTGKGEREKRKGEGRKESILISSVKRYCCFGYMIIGLLNRPYESQKKAYDIVGGTKSNAECHPKGDTVRNEIQRRMGLLCTS